MRFVIENDDVRAFREDGSNVPLGTLAPRNDEQIARVMKRVFELGRADKIREVKDVLRIRD